MKKINYKKYCEELENLFKAFLNKTAEGQIVISNNEVEQVKHCKIYVTKELYEKIASQNFEGIEWIKL